MLCVNLNGFQVHWDQIEALDFVLCLASGEVELADVIRFLRSDAGEGPRCSLAGGSAA